MISSLHFRDAASVLDLLRGGARAEKKAEPEVATPESAPMTPSPDALRDLQALQYALRQLERVDPLLQPVA